MRSNEGSWSWGGAEGMRDGSMRAKAPPRGRDHGCPVSHHGTHHRGGPTAGQQARETDADEGTGPSWSRPTRPVRVSIRPAQQGGNRSQRLPPCPSPCARMEHGPQQRCVQRVGNMYGRSSRRSFQRVRHPRSCRRSPRGHSMKSSAASRGYRYHIIAGCTRDARSARSGYERRVHRQEFHQAPCARSGPTSDPGHQARQQARAGRRTSGKKQSVNG